MRNLKSILPMLAFVLAIGMSFAFVGATGENYYATKYIQVPGGWATITIDCPDGDGECLVQFNDNPTPLNVYDSKSVSDPAEGNSTVEVRNVPTPIAD